MAGEGDVIVCPDHRPTQHRDNKPPWCKLCGLTETGKIPTAPEQDLGYAKRPMIFENPYKS